MSVPLATSAINLTLFLCCLQVKCGARRVAGHSCTLSPHSLSTNCGVRRVAGHSCTSPSLQMWRFGIYLRSSIVIWPSVIVREYQVFQWLCPLILICYKYVTAQQPRMFKISQTPSGFGFASVRTQQVALVTDPRQMS